MILFLLMACEAEVIEEGTKWEGYIYKRQANGDLELNETESAQLELIDMNGELLAEGTHPYSGSPAYWSLELPEGTEGTEVAIRANDEDADPMLWRGTAPEAFAIWLSKTIFLHSSGFNTQFFSAFEDLVAIQPLEEDMICHLWGQPLVPEDWAGANLELTTVDGDQVPVFSFSYDENGLLQQDSSEKIDLFLAFNITPGLTRFKVTAVDGRQSETVYPANGGELLSAMYYTLPDND